MSNKKSIFKGDRIRRLWRFSEGWNNYREGYICKDSEVVECNVTFYETKELDIPKLEVGEKIYINKLDRLFTIKDVARAIDGEIVYYVKENFEAIEDEKTEESLKIAEQKRFEEMNRVKEKDLRPDVSVQTKKWYQFWR